MAMVPLGLGVAVLAISSAAPVIRLAAPLGPEVIACLRVSVSVVVLGLLPGIVGHGLLNWAVRRVPVHVVSLAALLEPAGAARLAWLLLAEVPLARELLGALLLIAGVAVGAPAPLDWGMHAAALTYSR